MKSPGEKCERCGRCCKAIPCSIGLFACGDHRPCKALEQHGGFYLCGIVRKPSDYLDLGEAHEWKDEFMSGMFASMIGIGMGCDSCPTSEALTKSMREFHQKQLNGEPK